MASSVSPLAATVSAKARRSLSAHSESPGSLGVLSWIPVAPTCAANRSFSSVISLN